MAKIVKTPKCPCCGRGMTARVTFVVRLYPHQAQRLDELVAAAPCGEDGKPHNRSTFMRDILDKYINSGGENHV